MTVNTPSRINPRLGKLKGFTEEMQELGIAPSTKILDYKIINDRTIASLFNRPASARFLRLVRLPLGDGHTVITRSCLVRLNRCSGFGALG